jgi:hypothetical protein
MSTQRDKVTVGTTGNFVFSTESVLDTMVENVVGSSKVGIDLSLWFILRYELYSIPYLSADSTPRVKPLAKEKDLGRFDAYPVQYVE